ncbi:hypothetical protein QQX98_002617 [Neonectria punicea]|uniref:NACHT-NTPase and P-loop NTPases N-terminal domain-containing protein n=1 Tax=Neonectria punicea TaxID=979145 RepID=A0ABR1HJA7_9HYPO
MDPDHTIASVVGIVGAIAKTYETMDKIIGLPKAFDEVKKDLPLRKALRGIKAHRVETLMNKILNRLKKLALSQVFKSTIRKDLKAIEAAIEGLAKVEPSLADSEFDSLGTIHASQRVEHGATGQQNNSQGNDNTFNSGKYVTSGTGHTFNFGKDS